MNLTNSTDITVSPDGTAVFVAAAAPGISGAGGVRIYKLDVASGQLSIYAGTGISGYSGDGGPATNANFSTIYALTVTPAGEVIVSDAQSNARIRYIVPDSITLTNDAQQTLLLPAVGERARRRPHHRRQRKLDEYHRRCPHQRGEREHFR